MLDTAEIISKLRGFGVDFKEAQFIKDTENYISACELAKHWEEIHLVNAAGFDVDFIWMACIVLWECCGRTDRRSRTSTTLCKMATPRWSPRVCPMHAISGSMSGKNSSLTSQNT